jgi:hypothetical protein
MQPFLHMTRKDLWQLNVLGAHKAGHHVAAD